MSRTDLGHPPAHGPHQVGALPAAAALDEVAQRNGSRDDSRSLAGALGVLVPGPRDPTTVDRHQTEAGFRFGPWWEAYGWLVPVVALLALIVWSTATS